MIPDSPIRYQKDITPDHEFPDFPLAAPHRHIGNHRR